MRCPNCGNENPDDYTFCDECGAKLTADTGDEASAAPAGIDGAAAPAPPAEGAAAPAEMAPVDAAGAAPAAMAAPTPASYGTCPNCGAPIVPGEAFCNECGAELAALTASAPAASATTETPPEPAPAPVEAGAPTEMEPYVGGAPGESQPGGTPPMTEDTMVAGQAPAAGAEAAPMPGVMPVEEAAPPDAIAPAEPAAVPTPGMAAAPVATASTAAWATEALRQLDEGQAAMAKGDWVAYGQSVGSLKAYLENVVKGTAPEVAGMDVAAPAIAATAAAAAMPVAEAAAPGPIEGAGAVATDGGSGSGMARLVVIATGAEMPLPQQEEITVGREDPSSGIFPDIDLTPYGGEDGGVSRRHARLLHIGGDYFVEDLQSTNYTKLDGQRLPARVREKLEDGARLDFGRVAMIFRKG